MTIVSVNFHQFKNWKYSFIPYSHHNNLFISFIFILKVSISIQGTIKSISLFANLSMPTHLMNFIQLVFFYWIIYSVEFPDTPDLTCDDTDSCANDLFQTQEEPFGWKYHCTTFEQVRRASIKCIIIFSSTDNV